MRRFALVLLLTLAPLSALASSAIDLYFDGKRAAERGDYELAKELLTQAIETGQLRDYHMVRAYNTRGLIYYRQRDFQQAIADYTHAIEYGPEEPMLFRNRCFALLAVKQADAGMADCEMSASLEPGTAQSFDTLGYGYFLQRLYNVAIENFDQAIAIDATYANAYLHRGATYYRLGDETQGREDLLKAQELAPNDPDVAATLQAFGLTF